MIAKGSTIVAVVTNRDVINSYYVSLTLQARDQAKGIKYSMLYLLVGLIMACLITYAFLMIGIDRWFHEHSKSDNERANQAESQSD